MFKKGFNLVKIFIWFLKLNLMSLFPDPEFSLPILVFVEVDPVSKCGHFNPDASIWLVMIANIFNPVLAMMIQGYLGMFRLKFGILNV